jgi:hypothetical protein
MLIEPTTVASTARNSNPSGTCRMMMAIVSGITTIGVGFVKPLAIAKLAPASPSVKGV